VPFGYQDGTHPILVAAGCRDDNKPKPFQSLLEHTALQLFGIWPKSRFHEIQAYIDMNSITSKYAKVKKRRIYFEKLWVLLQCVFCVH
jgi:hypothetical protein